jgi:hypothetical protein
MKLTINTDTLEKHNLSLSQFVVLLTSYFNLDYGKSQEELEAKGMVQRNLFRDFPPVISNNIKNLVAQIIIDSDDKMLSCPIKDFDALAEKLMECFPEGIKAGKTYPWRGDKETVSLKLKTLVTKYDFSFTEEEAIAATKEYVNAFQPPYAYMHTIRNFLLYVKQEENGRYEIESQFMSIIENNRNKEHETDN